MGNQFLDDLNQADVLIHVVDMSGSTNEKGEPIQPGSYDPANDVKFLEVELDMWYIRLMKKAWDKFSRQVNQEKGKIDKSLVKQFSGLGATEDIVKAILKDIGLDEKSLVLWSEDEVNNFARELRIMTKPMIIAANKIDVKGAKENFERVKKEFPEMMMIPCSSESELALREAA